MSTWTEVSTTSNYIRHDWRKTMKTEDGHKAECVVYELNGRYYWSANIWIPFRPDLSRLAYGTYAATPHSLSVAKARATRIGKAAFKAAKTPRHFTRAA